MKRWLVRIGLLLVGVVGVLVIAGYAASQAQRHKSYTAEGG